MARTGDQEYAAAKAGYSAPAVSGSQLVRRPDVMAEVRLETSRILARAGVIAAERLAKIVADPKSKDSDAIAAAKVILPQALGLAADGKQPHEMTGEELQRAIDQLRREAGDRAKVIDAVEVVDVQQDATANTLFD
jgi:phage terminase small subunit